MGLTKIAVSVLPQTMPEQEPNGFALSSSGWDGNSGG
jgi:hypothetical protein